MGFQAHNVDLCRQRRPFLRRTRPQRLYLAWMRSSDSQSVDADIKKAVASGAAEQASPQLRSCLRLCSFETVRSRLHLLPTVRAFHDWPRSFEAEAHTTFVIACRIKRHQPFARPAHPRLNHLRGRAQLLRGVCERSVLGKQWKKLVEHVLAHNFGQRSAACPRVQASTGTALELRQWRHGAPARGKPRVATPAVGAGRWFGTVR